MVGVDLKKTAEIFSLLQTLPFQQSLMIPFQQD